MRLNEMYPNLQTEKKWSNFTKDIDQKPFCPNLNDLYPVADLGWSGWKLKKKKTP